MIYILLEPLLLVGVVYLAAALSHCLFILKWRGLRFGLLSFFLCILLERSIGLPLHHSLYLPGILIFLLQTIPYAFVRGHVSVVEERDYGEGKHEYFLGLCGLVFLSLGEAWKGQLGISLPVMVLEWLYLSFSFSGAVTYVIYYFMYHNVFQQEDMLPVLLTDRKEAKDFICAGLGWKRLSAGILLILFYLVFSVGLFSLRPVEIISPAAPLSIVTAIIAILFFRTNLRKAFPVKHYLRARAIERNMADTQSQHQKNLEKLIVKQKGKTGNVLLIIGESANRDHMKAFNPDYPIDTTPWQTSMKGKKGWYFYPHAYSNFSQTARSLSMILTGLNQYNHQSADWFITILDIAKACGMDTWWISNQTKVDKTDDYTTYISGKADHELWTNPSKGDEAKLLDLLDQVPEEGSHFIILHLMGSHLRYEGRIPPDWEILKTPGQSSRVGLYDTTLKYTDEILRRIMKKAEEKFHADAVVYVSDHSEDMKYTHGTGHFTYDMLHIPLWIYLSPEMEKAHPEMAEVLARHEDQIFTNDLIFDTLCGILRAPNTAYTPRFDLTSPEYDLPLEEARGQHGKVKISEDPALQMEK